MKNQFWFYNDFFFFALESVLILMIVYETRRSFIRGAVQGTLDERTLWTVRTKSLPRQAIFQK